MRFRPRGTPWPVAPAGRCNAAERVAGSLADAPIPAGNHGTPRGMRVEHLAKVDGDIRTLADGRAVDRNAQGDLKIAVMTYVGDQPVLRAEISIYFSRA
nr:DUF4442 domain-containing protein [Pseudomonas lalucatii]